MDKAKLTEVLNAKEGREETILQMVEEETAGLRTNSTRLLDEKKKLADRLKLYDGIDPEEHRSLQEELTALRAKAPDTETAVKAATKKLATDLEKKTLELGSERSLVTRLIIDNELTGALIGAGVTEQSMKYAKAFFLPRAKVETVGDERVANIDGKSLTEAVKEWSKTDDAKQFIKASGSTGGGAAGGAGGAGSGQTMKRGDFDRLTPGEKAKTAKAGVNIID